MDEGQCKSVLHSGPAEGSWHEAELFGPRGNREIVDEQTEATVESRDHTLKLLPHTVYFIFVVLLLGNFGIQYNKKGIIIALTDKQQSMVCH